MISLSARSGFYLLTHFLIMLLFSNKNCPKFLTDKDKYIKFEDSTFHGNISILKLYESLNVKSGILELISALKTAIKYNYFDIIQYAFTSSLHSKLIKSGKESLELIKECIYYNNSKAFI